MAQHSLGDLVSRRSVLKSSATLLGSGIFASVRADAQAESGYAKLSTPRLETPVAPVNRQFAAVGPAQPVRRPPHEQGTIKVTFDLLPTTMSYDLPTFFFMVTENGIKFTNFAVETYDPRHWMATGAAASFEPLQDQANRYVRVWIQHQSAARIVVRKRYALCNNEEQIAHPDIPSGSPYGEGDWVDEWVYIYPDGTNLRHMKIFTGLAPMALPFGYARTPPKVVYEFVESAVQGLPGHMPTDDIELAALTLVRLIGDHTEIFLPEGRATTVSYKPYPEAFGDWRDANILLVNLKAKYKPFTIGLPYGVRIQPYLPDGPLRYVFDTFGWTPGTNRPYFTSLAHLLNYWHYRRTDHTLEQIYLQGMTNADDPVKQLVSLVWSWIAGPRLHMEGLKPSYTVFTYDPAQKAYIVPRKGWGPVALEFTLEQDRDFRKRAPNSIVNPVFIVKDWGEADFRLQIDSKPVLQGENFRVGYEESPTGKDLIVWLKMETSETVRFSILPT